MKRMNMPVLKMLAVFLASMAVVNAQQSREVIMQTTAGPIKGIEEFYNETKKYVTSFYGIPFAKPPLGDLRFAPAEAVTPWRETIDCTSKKLFQVCPQFPSMGGNLSLGREDCLYMNIFVPVKWNERDQFDLPTFFWIYGGGYTIGDDYEFGWYDGKNLATSRNVIVVEPNYRIGALGFFASNALVKESGGTTGNQGTQDQQVALKFTYENIERFGGNQKKITIAGESAGAFSVCWHYVSSESRKYFSSAVMQSGTCSSAVFFVPLQRALTFSAEVAAKVGCDRDDLTCLRNVKYSDFFMQDNSWPIPVPGTNHSIVPPLNLVMPYGPTIDEDPRGLMARPIDVLDKVHNIQGIKPLLLGNNEDEGTIFLFLLSKQIPSVSVPLTEAMVPDVLEHFFNVTTTNEILREYASKEEYKDADAKAAAILRDFFFVCSNEYIAEKLASVQVPIWMYHFIMDIPLWLDYDLLGDYHTIEMSFVFDNEFPPLLHTFGEREKEMAKNAGIFWTNFVRNLNPNGLAAPIYWPQFTLDRDGTGQQYLKLDVPPDTADYLEKPQCDFWRTRHEKFYYDTGPN